ncbi:MAG: hypothetical protein KIS88_01235 [Anaerolineales bacterium]|nr:hypothetical protein [Anaerolineales bacterium]
MLTVLDSPLGGILYSLLMLLMLSSLSLWLHNRAGRAGLVRGVKLGLAALMGLRLLQLSVYIFAWLGWPLAAAASAPGERGVLVLSLAIVVWLWARRPAAERRSRLIAALPLVGAGLLALLMLLYWLGVPAGSSFNYTDADYAWSATAGLIAVLGLLQIVAGRKDGRPGIALGLTQVSLLLLGHVVHILLAEPFGNLPLLAQAAALLATPLLFSLPDLQPQPAALPQAEIAELDELLESSDEDATLEDGGDEDRWPLSYDEDSEDSEEDFFQLGTELPSIEEMEAEEIEAEEQFSLSVAQSAAPAFFDEPEPQSEQHPVMLSAPEELARQVAEALGADVCVLATHNDTQLQLEVQYGYNLLRQAPLEPADISLREVPRLASALQRVRTLRLEVDAAPGELTALSQALRLSFPGHLLLAPFDFPQDLRRWAVLAIHLEQPWQTSDEILLERRTATLGSELAETLGVVDRVSSPSWQTHPLEHSREDVETLQEENARYRADVERLLAHIDALQTQPTGTELEAGQGTGLSALQQENQRLKQSLADLQAAPAASSGVLVTSSHITAEQAKEELRLALEEVAAVHARLEVAQQAITEAAQEQPDARIPAEQVELVTSIAQELRQPLSSVMGYTDLLLGESVGLLGALQRKFLERVRSSTERMNALIDNLIRIAELDPEGQNVQRGRVDLGEVIDDALSLLREPMQEKRIALRVNLPRQMLSLNTDRDALQQILYHLLQNADAATPVGGAISLAAVFEEQDELGEYVLIQVSDSGGGIPEEALPRVFSRVYRAQNPVISGVGDSGVGLTIAETLTKALGGRIWVESQAGVGATFSVLLPLTAAAS